MTVLPPARDLARVVLAVLVLLLLIVSSLWVLQPFLPALVWATMIVVATWPLMLRLQTLLWNRRGLAVAVMSAALLLLVVVPLSLAVVTLLDNALVLKNHVSDLGTLRLPGPPGWLARIPVVGERATAEWQAVTAVGPAALAARATPYAGKIGSWVLLKAGSLGVLGVHFLLTVALSAILYSQGETAANGVRRFARRLAGERGDNSVVLAGQAIRAVAMGIVITAVVQSLLGGIGLAVTGVPFAGPLTSLMFMFCIAQLGPVLILLPATIWLFYQDQTIAGSVLLLWTLAVGSLDNILRPYLIKRGADLPLLLILAGVLGGLFAFGIVGLFVGPVLLAVSYTLLDSWVREQADPEADPLP